MNNVWAIILTVLVVVDIIISVSNTVQIDNNAEIVKLLNRHVYALNTEEEREASRRVDSVVNSLTWNLEHIIEEAVGTELKRASAESIKQELEARLAAAKEKNSIDTRGTV